ncbi:MAG: GspE/PulE family protein [Pseudomonadota bacterium]
MMIGDWLVRKGLIMEAGRAEALSFQSQFGGLFGQACLKLGLLREDDLLVTLSEQLLIDVLPDDALPDSGGVAAACDGLDLPPAWFLEHDAVAWARGGNNGSPLVLNIVARNPIAAGLQEAIDKRFDGETRYFLASNRRVDQCLDLLRKDRDEEDGTGNSLARLRQLAEEAPVIDFVNGLFADALDMDASDVHVEPAEFGFRTRYRVDGVLGLDRDHPKQLYDAVATRIKILSDMDIAERRLPQDGRQGVRIGGKEVDLRVSSLPGAHGESIVIRLLKKKSDIPDIEGLGLDGQLLAQFRRISSEPNGIILVTGPTGSGKSTTLYRLIEEINNGERKIITIEDPIEYEVEGITQVHARADIGLSFASGMRAMLRQDPDVIMVGEIRDSETALIGTTAALTGHLVLSTLHTNSALGAIERLVDLQVDTFLIEASLRGIIGQRLVRRMCKHCAAPMAADAVPVHIQHIVEDVRRVRGISGEPFNWRQPVGCPACNHTGYRGRLGVFEIIEMKRDSKTVLQQDKGAEMKLAELRDNGFRNMAEDAILKASFGMTSLAEVERIFGKV